MHNQLKGKRDTIRSSAVSPGGHKQPHQLRSALVLMFGIMYFLLFLPMQRQKKKTQLMLAELKSGDTVITAGGIVGTVTTLEKDTVVIRVKPDNLKLQITRSSISGTVPPADAVVAK